MQPPQSGLPANQKHSPSVVRHVFPGVQLQLEQRRMETLGKEAFIGGNLLTLGVQKTSKLAPPS
jgi:hypothetical protein